MNKRAITKKEIAIVAKMMSKAFEADPLYEYFVPNEAKRKAFIEEFMRFRLRFAMKYGAVIVTDDLTGVIVTIPPNVQMTQGHVLFMGGVKAILKAGGETPSRLVEFENLATEYLGQKLTDESKYWHIGPLAVLPEAQGKGIGKQLLLGEIEKIKAQSQPCYIETQTERNKLMYEKMGFEAIGEIKPKNGNFTNYLMTLK